MITLNMEIKIQCFGQISDLTGDCDLTISNVYNLMELKERLLKTYPKLRSINFTIALNQKITNSNTVLTNGDVVALLPPFSGG